MQPLVLEAHGKHAQAVQFTRDDNYLISVGQDAEIRLWHVPGFEPAGVISGHTKSVNAISLNRTESRMATVSSDGTARVWAFPGGRRWQFFPGPAMSSSTPPRRCC